MSRSTLLAWPLATAAFVLGLFFGTLHWFPASYWMEVHSVHVDSGRGAFADLPMQVDREVKDDFLGVRIVTVRRWDGGWVTACSVPISSVYHTGDKLPRNLTVRWWTAGQCSFLGADRYMLSTSWTIKGVGLLPDKVVTIDSNPFDLLE